MKYEKERNERIQGQNDMLQQALTLLENTIGQVKLDKEAIERENRRLKEFLEAKDLEIDKDGYNRMLDF